ncbi:MAG: hypothetical protein JNL73_17310 [Anaerolineales bacterium]|nr:hypothetical protein [Anaerolineales bacterium]
MTGIFPIDWLVLTISLFNTGLLAWLGLTVVLTAQPRTPGAIAAGASLLVASAFFVSHSAIVGQPLHSAPGLELLWQASLYAVIALPAAWYGVVLWYAGFWSTPTSTLRRRHTPVAVLAGGLLALLLAMLALGRALPTLNQAITLDVSSPDRAGQIALFGLTYPVYGLLSMGAALDALLRPGPVTRATATPARRRAQPWLLAASVLLLLVSLVASFGLQAATQSISRVEDFASRAQTYLWLVGLDILAASLIGLIGLFVGQALAEYEVFTGRSLPRRGLRRYWRRAVVLCAGISPPVAFALVRRSEPVYVVLMTLLLLIAFYAMVSWRSFIERERTVSLLRPLTAEAFAWMRRPARPRATDGSEPPALGINATALLTTLCRDSIGATRAIVLPQGPLAALAGAPLQYPPTTAPAPAIDGAQLRARLDPAGGLGASLDPAEWHGLSWAVQLWSERGPIGVLLLGPKADGGLYAQEDIEVARAGGERLLDSVISTELTNRLIALQQRRLAEGQVLDQRLRRELHDEVLPRLHAAMLTLSDPSAQSQSLRELAGVHHRLSDLVRAMPNATAPELQRHGFFGALRRVIEVDLHGAFDKVNWTVPAEAEQAAAELPDFARETLYFAAREALRNAARHGRGGEANRALAVTVASAVTPLVENTPRALQVHITDDGVGLAQSGATAGTQHGLTLHTTLMAVAGGALEIDSPSAAGTHIHLHIPLDGDAPPAL